MDLANTDPVATLGRTMLAAVKATGFLTARLRKMGLPTGKTDLTREEYGLVYGGALLKACEEIVKLEEENAALREACGRGPSATALQEEMAVDGVQEDERPGAEGLARQDVHDPGEGVLHRVQEPGGDPDGEAGVHFI